MAVIYCPECDSEIPENEIICPSCGFNLDTYDEGGDDSEFNALLNAANKKLNEEAEDEEEDENEAVFAEGAAMSQSQINALLDGNVVDLSGDAPKKEKKVKKADKSVRKKVENKAEEKEEIAFSQPESEQSSVQAPPVTEAAQEKAEEPKKVKKEKRQTPKKPCKSASPFVITAAAAVVALALGFCISFLMFGADFKTPEEKFAIKAANAVNSKLEVNEQLCVYKAYVKMGAASDECILYAVTDYMDVITAEKYRITVNKDNEGVINIYYTVDENSPEYIAMKESNDPEIRIQASILKSYSDSIETAHREISIGSPAWVRVDNSKININIKSK